MANVVRDPKEHPDAIIPDLAQPNPLVAFTRDPEPVHELPQGQIERLGDREAPQLAGILALARRTLIATSVPLATSVPASDLRPRTVSFPGTEVVPGRRSEIESAAAFADRRVGCPLSWPGGGAASRSLVLDVLDHRLRSVDERARRRRTVACVCGRGRGSVRQAW